ncbi:hypothetical protein IAT40_006522 [Kwoniella sp. CBS 6097]
MSSPKQNNALPDPTELRLGFTQLSVAETSVKTREDDRSSSPPPPQDASAPPYYPLAEISASPTDERYVEKTCESPTDIERKDWFLSDARRMSNVSMNSEDLETDRPMDLDHSDAGYSDGGAGQQDRHSDYGASSSPGQEHMSDYLTTQDGSTVLNHRQSLRVCRDSSRTESRFPGSSLMAQAQTTPRFSAGMTRSISFLPTNRRLAGSVVGGRIDTHRGRSRLPGGSSSRRDRPQRRNAMVDREIENLKEMIAQHQSKGDDHAVEE